MTIDKAIEIKEKQYTDPWLAPKGKLAEADKLSIEALHTVKNLRHYPECPVPNLLLGETEE